MTQSNLRPCPVCKGKRFIDGFTHNKRSLLCPVCGGDGYVPALTDPDVIAFGRKLEALKKRGKDETVS